ncbi:MAG: class I SAM-dependent methyltransferase, partial [Rickettsiaceae bacterium]|nr:class I SAM-dependent methyltransferase [Rickettsiaceae bacterium]
DNKTELAKYAELYSSSGYNETPKYLVFRDLPNLFKKYNVTKHALDFGCGAGESTLFLKSQGFEVCGVDINEEMLVHARKSDPAGEYVSICNDKIPYQDNAYELVFASFVLLEMSSLEQIQKSLHEIARVLKPGGMFLAILDNENLYKHNWKLINTDFPQNKSLKRGQKVKVEFLDKGFSIEDYYWPREDYIKVMKNAGLDLLEIYEPLGIESDGVDWRDEIITPPISLYITVKR